MRNFLDKVVLITGASSGIGSALAKDFARQGAKLVLTARRLDRLKALALELGEERTLSIPCDVTSDTDLQTVVAEVKKKWGKIDVVIANAGFGIQGNLEKLALEDYRRQMETNVFGLLRTVYATLDELKKNRGRLAIMGSVAGYISTPGASAYAMSKFCLCALSQSLWVELADYGIAVTLINPGYVASEIRHKNNREKLYLSSKDPVPPWLVMPTDKASKQMIKAIYKRKKEITITNHGKILVWLQRHFPGLMRYFISKFNRE